MMSYHQIPPAPDSPHLWPVHIPEAILPGCEPEGSLRVLVTRVVVEFTDVEDLHADHGGDVAAGYVLLPGHYYELPSGAVIYGRDDGSNGQWWRSLWVAEAGILKRQYTDNRSSRTSRVHIIDLANYALRMNFSDGRWPHGQPRWLGFNLTED